MTVEDITPEGSVAPVFLDTTPNPTVDPFPDDALAAESLRCSTTVRLIALGLTEDEARGVTGYSGELTTPA